MQQGKECWHCESYSNNQTGCWTKDICLADMMDGTPNWNKKLPHDHKCHREEKPCKAN